MRAFISNFYSNSYSLLNNPFTQLWTQTTRNFWEAIPKRDYPIQEFAAAYPTFSRIAKIPFTTFGNFSYEFGKRFFDTLAVLKATSDLDSLNKMTTFAIGLLREFRGEDDPLIEKLEAGNAGLGVTMFGKHVISLTKLEFLNVWDPKNHSLNYGKICKTIYPIFFQIAHFTQLSSYLIKCKIVNFAPVANAIGEKHPILKSTVDKVYNIGLSKFKNYLVIAGSIIAIGAVLEVIIVKALNYYKGPKDAENEPTVLGFLDTFTYEETLENFVNLINNITKVLVVYGSSLGGWSTSEKVFRATSHILGIANLYKLTGQQLKEQREAEAVDKKMSDLFGQASLGHDPGFTVGSIPDEVLFSVTSN